MALLGLGLAGLGLSRRRTHPADMPLLVSMTVDHGSEFTSKALED